MSKTLFQQGLSSCCFCTGVEQCSYARKYHKKYENNRVDFFSKNKKVIIYVNVPKLDYTNYNVNEQISWLEIQKWTCWLYNFLITILHLKKLKSNEIIIIWSRHFWSCMYNSKVIRHQVQLLHLQDNTLPGERMKFTVFKLLKFDNL